MNPLRWLEQKSYLGEIIKDYGCIEDRRAALGRTYIEKRATHVEYTEPVNYAGILIFAVALFLIVMATLHHH
jgi:hypothetical protein